MPATPVVARATMSPMRRTVLLATALVLSLTSCSDDDPGPEPAPSQAPATTADVASTDPGSELEFGDPATLVWQPAQGLTGVLDLTVESVTEQRQSVLDGWARDEAMAAARPYFVLVSLTNSGESDLSGQAVPLYLRDDNGTLGAPWTLGGDFTPCQSGPLPAPFEPGDEAEMCLVYLAPDGARIADMAFEPTEGYDPIIWTGDVRMAREPRTRKGRGKKG